MFEGRCVGVHGGGSAGHGLDDDSGVFGKADDLAARDPAVVEGERRAVVADAAAALAEMPAAPMMEPTRPRPAAPPAAFLPAPPSERWS